MNWHLANERRLQRVVIPSEWIWSESTGGFIRSRHTFGVKLCLHVGSSMRLSHYKFFFDCYFILNYNVLCYIFVRLGEALRLEGRNYYQAGSPTRFGWWMARPATESRTDDWFEIRSSQRRSESIAAVVESACGSTSVSSNPARLITLDGKSIYKFL